MKELGNIFHDFQILEESVIPKYLQLADAIMVNIEQGYLKKGMSIPSINDLNFCYNISRDTAIRGYKYLREVGIIDSIPGKGYFIANVDFRKCLKICMLFNKLSKHKKIIYDAFINRIGNRIPLKLYIYNNDFNLFKKIITENDNDFSHYVIIPHFIENEEAAETLINNIAPQKLVIIDKHIKQIKHPHISDL